MNDHETHLLNFLLKDRRERARYLLEKKRDEFTSLLHHPRIFKPHVLHKIEPRLQTSKDIAERLQEAGGVSCYLISSDPDLDQQTMSIEEALAQIVGYGMGTFASVLPGKLGYLETEDAGERFIVY